MTSTTFFRLHESMHLAVTSGGTRGARRVQSEQSVRRGTDRVVGRLQQTVGLRQRALLMMRVMMHVMMLLLLLLQLLLLLLLLLLLGRKDLLVPAFRATTHLRANTQQPDHAEQCHSNLKSR